MLKWCLSLIRKPAHSPEHALAWERPYAPTSTHYVIQLGVFMASRNSMKKFLPRSTGGRAMRVAWCGRMSSMANHNPFVEIQITTSLRKLLCTRFRQESGRRTHVSPNGPLTPLRILPPPPHPQPRPPTPLTPATH